MIIVKIQGGLGNQMFQYAFGRNLSFLHNVPFKVDTSYLRQVNQSNRVLAINNFNTVLHEANLFERLLSKISGDYFDGYWQSEKNFTEDAETIKKDFTLKNPLSKSGQNIKEKILATPNPVSLHVRRGDYISISKITDVYIQLPFSYYERSMKSVLEKYPDAHFFVSSDDIAWVKDNFGINYPTTFISSPEIPDYEELILMSLCKHNIIANSTFSWWGAFLNQNAGKIVIAPKNWFKDESKNGSDLIPKEWITI